MVGPVDQRDIGVRALQGLHDGHAAETGADDHDLFSGGRTGHYYLPWR
jgi:hypothetical protein